MNLKTLIRPFNYANRYQKWLLKDYATTLARLKKHYEEEVFGSGSREAVFEHSQNAATFVWQPRESYTDETNFLIDLFKSTLARYQYYCRDADERSETYDGGHILTIHRYTLLSLPGAESMGTITLESGFTHSRSIALKITADYSLSGGRELSFETLMQRLLTYPF